MANAGLAERVDRLAWDDLGDQPDDRRLGPGGGGRRDQATLGRLRLRRPSAKSGVAQRRHRRASAPTDLMGGSSSRSTKHHFGAQDDECPRHLELAPCGRLRARENQERGQFAVGGDHDGDHTSGEFGCYSAARVELPQG